MGYTLYVYDINLTLTNDAFADASGWISLYLRAHSTGELLDTAYMDVSIPAKSTVVDSFTAYFKTAYDKTQDVYIEPQPDAGAVSCLACGGKGKLPLNLWALAEGTKAKLAEITRVEHTFEPPPVVFFPPGE